MKKLLFILFFFSGINAVAQPSFSIASLTSSNQQLIEDAVAPGLLIVHRQYRLQDVTAATPSFFGWGGGPHFGSAYSLAVKTAEGYYIGHSAVCPWDYDAKYDEYRNNEQYAPVLSGSEYRQLGDTVFSPLPFRDIPVTEISENRVYAMQDTVFGNKGFVDAAAAGAVKGWVVWVTAEKPLAENPAQPLSCIIYRSELTFESGKQLYEINPPAIQTNVLGGVYVMPEVTDVGQFTFKLCGVLHFENNKWHIVSLSNTPATEALQTPHGGLTPVEEAQTLPSSNNRRNR